MSHFGIDYAEILHAAGYRLTRQRATILDAVCAGGGHTTLKAIYARATTTDPTIDRSSVYRTLKLFIGLGLVMSGTNATNDVVYEIATPQPHHHLACVCCNREQAIGPDELAIVFEFIGQRYGFTVTATHLVLPGICRRCQAAQDAPRT